jgi:peptide/nickel transport system permease protein
VASSLPLSTSKNGLSKRPQTVKDNTVKLASSTHTGRDRTLFAGLRKNIWVRFIGQRLAGLFAVLVALTIATFMMVRLIPGDPAENLAGPNTTGAELEELRRSLLLDRPLPEQFIHYVQNLLSGDLGTSYLTRQPVSEIIADRLPQSAQMAVLALILVLVSAILLGLIAGAVTQGGRRRKTELGFTAVTSVVGSVPEFLAGTFLAFIFAVSLGLLPVAGADGWQGLVLPVLALSLRPIAVLSRIVRVETLNVLAQDYIRTARSKRLPAPLIYLRHILPNVLTAALTIGGVLFAGLIGGGVVVEAVFARAGVGTALVNAVLSRDYPVVQGIMLLLGAAVVVINAIVDVVLGLIDPRSLAAQS